MKKAFRIFIIAVPIVVVCLAVGVNYAIDHVLPYSPIRPHRCTASEMARHHPQMISPDAFTSHWDEFDITVEDSIRLKGWFIPSIAGRPQGTIVLLHGIASCRFAMLPIAHTFTQNGFNCILYDARAHGESAGLNCTFGYYEKHDVSAYLDSALVRYPNSGPFGIFGDSFGAAVAVQALAIDDRLKCGVAESPFATLREVIHDYFRQMFLVPSDFIPDAALKRSEQIAQFQIDRVNPESDARKIVQPTMIIHGESDTKISPRYGRRVYDSLASSVKEWYPIPHAGHDDLSRIAGPEYERRILAFFKKYLNAGAPPA